VAMKKLN